MEENKNFDNETHCYFNEDTQEWIPYYQLESVFSTRAKERMLSGNPVLKSEQGRAKEKQGQRTDIIQISEESQIKEQIFEQWGIMSNKEIKAMNEIEQPTLF